jgi:hypothetical protein
MCGEWTRRCGVGWGVRSWRRTRRRRKRTWSVESWRRRKKRKRRSFGFARMRWRKRPENDDERCCVDEQHHRRCLGVEEVEVVELEMVGARSRPRRIARPRR